MLVTPCCPRRHSTRLPRPRRRPTGWDRHSRRSPTSRTTPSWQSTRRSHRRSLASGATRQGKSIGRISTLGGRSGRAVAQSFYRSARPPRLKYGAPMTVPRDRAGSTQNSLARRVCVQPSRQLAHSGRSSPPPRSAMPAATPPGSSPVSSRMSRCSRFSSVSSSSTPPRTTSPPAHRRAPQDNETPEPRGFRGSDGLRHHIGAACRNRTDDLFITSESLYRLS